MPLFLVPIVGLGVSAAATLYGAKKGYDGASTLKKANSMGKSAQNKHKRHLRLLQSARANAAERLEAYDSLRKNVREGTFSRLMGLIAKLDQEAQLRALKDLGELEEFRENVPEFQDQVLSYSGVGKKALKGVVAGAGARAVATSAASQFGVASTGAAISGLSGAALESATLAWLGGGAISAGGGGMALGSAVLGGVVIAPAIALGGWSLARQGSKALSRATTYAADVDKAVAKLEVAVGCLHQIEARIGELTGLVERLDERAHAAMDRLALVLEESDADEHAAAFSLSMLLAKALADVLRAPVLNERGEPSEESSEVLEQYTEMAEAEA